MFHQLSPLFGLAIAGLIVYLCYRCYDSRRPKTYCPKCGGEMLPDAQKYRYTIEWTCCECGDTFEQLRNG